MPGDLTDSRHDSTVPLEVIDVSAHGFLARSTATLPDDTHGLVRVHLGADEVAMEQAVLVRSVRLRGGAALRFSYRSARSAWHRCIEDLEVRDAPPGTVRRVRAAAEIGEDWSVHDGVLA